MQTGTSHGGIVLPDGSIKKVAVDFDTLKVLGDGRGSMAPAVRCSTAPARCRQSYFDKFPEVQTLEIHLATGFQNLFMDHPAYPAELTNTVHSYLEPTTRRAQRRPD